MNSMDGTIRNPIPVDRIYIRSKFDTLANRESYDIFFFGERFRAYLTRDHNVMVAWLNDVHRFHGFRTEPLIVGLAIQWSQDPSASDAPPAIIQLCVDRRCIIFQLLHASEIPFRLYRFLSDRNNTFVGIKIDIICRKLRWHWGFVVGTARDVRELAARSEPLGALAATFLGCPCAMMPRWISRSQWDRRVLSPAQIKHACTDAYIASQLGFRFLRPASRERMDSFH